MVKNLEEFFSERAQGMKVSEIRELLKLTNKPGIISFAGGLPDPELFPAEQIEEICTDVLAKYKKHALQYSATEGIMPLREALVDHMKRTSPCDFDVNNIIITSGSQQALDLVSKIFVNPGDYVVTGAPTYLGGIGAIRAYEARFKSVALDEHGMKPDVLHTTLDELEKKGIRPKFIYVVPSFQNPMGVTLPEDRRKEIAEIAIERDLLILEDTPYCELKFTDQENYKDIYFYAPENTIHMGTFSKILAPGLRVAWVLAPEEVINKIVLAKQGADLCTAAFPQYIAFEYMRRGYIYNHIEEIRKVYGEKRDTMIEAMKKYFPEGVKWTEPKGGMFLWVTLPEGCDTVRMFERALKRNVAYVIGKAFYVDGGGVNSMRLNFSYSSNQTIEEGMRRLGKVIERKLKEVPR